MRFIYRQIFKMVWKSIGKHDKKTMERIKDPADIEVSQVNYFQDDKKSHLMNIYRKKDEEKRPLLFDIHGGGWMYGDCNLNGHFANYMAAKEYVVATPSYSLVFEAKIDVMIQELYQALIYIYSKAEDYGIDKNRIYLTGDSAGGQLSLLILSILQSEELRKIYKIGVLPFDIKAACLCNPVVYIKDLDFLDGHKHLNNGCKDTFLALLCGNDYKKERNVIFSHTDFTDVVKEVGVLPPLMITTSKGDTAFYGQAKRLSDELSSKGFNCEFYSLDDPTFTHVYNVTDPTDERSIDINRRIDEFFKKN